MDGRVVVGRICRPSLTRSHGRGYGFPFDQLQVYLAEGKYFVCSDVGKGRMQWYAMLGQPAGNKVRGSARVHLRSSPDLPIEPRTDDRLTDRPTKPHHQVEGPQGPHLLKAYEGWSKEVVELLEQTKEVRALVR